KKQTCQSKRLNLKNVTKRQTYVGVFLALGLQLFFLGSLPHARGIVPVRAIIHRLFSAIN
ncbi:MAG: hypothetical protein OXC48_10975, partial [Endozoicomonadaceae bacterium]|nr:hypothetical protein [Endozoicomonadaceae bacterium]